MDGREPATESLKQFQQKRVYLMVCSTFALAIFYAQLRTPTTAQRLHVLTISPCSPIWLSYVQRGTALVPPVTVS